MLGVIRDCLPCTSSFWEKLKQFYKKEKKTLNSPTWVVPGPVSDIGQGSPRAKDNEKIRAATNAGGSKAMGLLSNYAKKKPAANPDEDVVMASESESEVDFDTAIKNAAEGFR